MAATPYSVGMVASRETVLAALVESVATLRGATLKPAMPTAATRKVAKVTAVTPVTVAVEQAVVAAAETLEATPLAEPRLVAAATHLTALVVMERRLRRTTRMWPATGWVEPARAEIRLAETESEAPGPVGMPR